MRRRGQSLVEASLALTVFLALVLTLIDAGRLFLARTSQADRLRDVARWAAMHPDDTVGIRERAGQAGFEADSVRVDVQNTGTPAERIVIRATTAPIGQITPWLGAGQASFEASALVER